ncbi:UdgX family uracil-DNA binding protein [Methyloferula stellata]|uniref:UdgX family uracil-DNA binding protein n=1 Tax=Methyloferula stellata TaxID=876270 RepID=UPI00039ACFB5|nr:UdgX family uracil-DNA binding protein [Methyloferula stellata]
MKTNAALTQLAAEAAGCERCPLYKDATQTVFGEGPASASIMMVGEQPGDQEDRTGHPFVGPAGQILDRALGEAGLARETIYVTNVLKHFKHEMRGKRRLHKRPNQDEIKKCRWWLDKEIAIVQLKLIVALGVTAAQALTGRKLTLTRERGKTLDLWDGQQGMLTVHPSSILRMPDESARHEAFAGLVADLARVSEIAG